jgi:phosphohistidine swiveling domain-containing protein
MEFVDIRNCKNFEGKAGNLARISDDFNILDGFVVTDKFFKRFLSFNNIELSDNLNIICDNIMKGVFDFSELIEFYDGYNFDKVVVRSSASVEDGSDYSFSGQFSSFLNVSRDSLILYIKKCWTSMFNENVYLYMKENGIVSDISFDVIIQKMIVSNYSGVAFSVNPSNGKREVFIEVTDGQCEDLVSGKVLPHVYHVNQRIDFDDFINRNKIIEICDNVKKLKKLFNRDIEIEFAFKDNLFYIFQVRVVTKVYFDLISYIKNEYWCCFKNNRWSLFTRSLWIMGVYKYKNEIINNDIVEDITLFNSDGSQLRGFNGNQPPLDEITVSKHKSDDINEYIFSSNLIAKFINDFSTVIKGNISNNDFKEFRKNLRVLIFKNAVINSYEYLIGSLGNALYDRLDDYTKDNISKWRNSEENSYFSIYDDVFSYVINYFGIDIDRESFVNYVHVNELLNLCYFRLRVSTLVKRINERKKFGFVLLNLNNEKFVNKVVIDKDVITTVRDRFDEILISSCDNDCDGIKGTSTFKNGKVIVGECVVVDDDISKLDVDLCDKILVCGVTTARDIKYIKNVKALIVDSGGILCHSAIFSREFGIPCLMGSVRGTKYFVSGDILKFDVDNEMVVKL